MNRKIRRTAAGIGDDAWTPIRYPRAVYDETTGRWISDAEIAEVPYTAFASEKTHAVTARLVVRRVRDLNPKADADTDTDTDTDTDRAPASKPSGSAGRPPARPAHAPEGAARPRRARPRPTRRSPNAVARPQGQRGHTSPTIATGHQQLIIKESVRSQDQLQIQFSRDVDNNDRARDRVHFYGSSPQAWG
ncbi:hypothetical protein [Frankia sp. Cr2]|uniref:hypothetical protein n=1 Tax=Frankia sp. Cr2 TaxID=3073932 RepID=UPI003A0FC145